MEQALLAQHYAYLQRSAYNMLRKAMWSNALSGSAKIMTEYQMQVIKDRKNTAQEVAKATKRAAPTDTEKMQATLAERVNKERIRAQWTEEDMKNLLNRLTGAVGKEAAEKILLEAGKNDEDENASIDVTDWEDDPRIAMQALLDHAANFKPTYAGEEPTLTIELAMQTRIKPSALYYAWLKLRANARHEK